MGRDWRIWASSTSRLIHRRRAAGRSGGFKRCRIGCRRNRFWPGSRRWPKPMPGGTSKNSAWSATTTAYRSSIASYRYRRARCVRIRQGDGESASTPRRSLAVFHGRRCLGRYDSKGSQLVNLSRLTARDRPWARPPSGWRRAQGCQGRFAPRRGDLASGEAIPDSPSARRAHAWQVGSGKWS